MLSPIAAEEYKQINAAKFWYSYIQKQPYSLPYMMHNFSVQNVCKDYF